MADTASFLQRLILSATDLKSLTAQQKSGEPWPDALVEDYLNILRDLVTLANIIDSNAQDTVLGVSRLEQIAGELQTAYSKCNSRVNRMLTEDRRLEQLIYAW